MFKASELPSIKSLRSFIASAQHSSFSKAADELCLTQGAVSKQIAQLELQLGQALFHRHSQGLSLTDSGKRYLPQVIAALEILQQSTLEVMQRGQLNHELVINAPPSFASLWLVPHLGHFQSLAPQFTFTIQTRNDSDLAEQSARHLTIQCLPLSKHYEHHTLLCCEYLELIAPVHHRNAPLIPHITRPQLWARFHQQHPPLSTPRYHSVGFEHFYLSLEAVKQGQGCALIPNFMLTPTSDKVQRLGLEIESGYGYYLNIPKHMKQDSGVIELTHWLVEHLHRSSL